MESYLYYTTYEADYRNDQGSDGNLIS